MSVSVNFQIGKDFIQRCITYVNNLLSGSWQFGSLRYIVAVALAQIIFRDLARLLWSEVEAAYMWLVFWMVERTWVTLMQSLSSELRSVVSLWKKYCIIFFLNWRISVAYSVPYTIPVKLLNPCTIIDEITTKLSSGSPYQAVRCEAAHALSACANNHTVFLAHHHLFSESKSKV